MHYSLAYRVSSNSQLTIETRPGSDTMRFLRLRRRRRQPKTPMFLLDLELPFEEVLADLSYPGGDPARHRATTPILIRTV
jgi:hypothetical protein